jgi:hypothetical protein
VIKGEFDVVNYSKIMKKRKLLQAKMCEEPYYLAIKLSPVRAWKVPIPPVTKYRLL